jgi:hypothetical protein
MVEKVEIKEFPEEVKNSGHFVSPRGLQVHINNQGNAGI